MFYGKTFHIIFTLAKDMFKIRHTAFELNFPEEIKLNCELIDLCFYTLHDDVFFFQNDCNIIENYLFRLFFGGLVCCHTAINVSNSTLLSTISADTELSFNININ